MSLVQTSLNWLGMRVRDRVTGFQGVVTSCCFDLYGCVQACIAPSASGDKLESGFWFDVKRLESLSEERVMDLPDFDLAYGEEKGPASKPSFRSMPGR